MDSKVPSNVAVSCSTHRTCLTFLSRKLSPAAVHVDLDYVSVPERYDERGDIEIGDYGGN